MNAKDAPFATAMAVLALGIVRALDEYPGPNARTVVLRLRRIGTGLRHAHPRRLAAGARHFAALLLIAIVGKPRA